MYVLMAVTVEDFIPFYQDESSRAAGKQQRELRFLGAGELALQLCWDTCARVIVPLAIPLGASISDCI